MALSKPRALAAHFLRTSAPNVPPQHLLVHEKPRRERRVSVFGAAPCRQTSPGPPRTWRSSPVLAVGESVTGSKRMSSFARS